MQNETFWKIPNLRSIPPADFFPILYNNMHGLPNSLKNFPPSGCCGSAKSLNFTEYLTSEVLLNSPNILLNSPYYLFGLSANLEQGNRGCCRPSTRILLSVIGVQTVLIRIQPKKNIMKIIKRFALLEIRIYTIQINSY